MSFLDIPLDTAVTEVFVHECEKENRDVNLWGFS